VRPTYQGANPIADVWATYALRLISRYFIRSVKDRLDEEANAAMTLAATYAGVGFGNAGVHLCHGMSYPISGLNKAYVHPGYDPKKPLVPHGISVVMSSPAIFRWTAAADPGRHAEAAALLRGDNPPVSLRMYTSEDDRVAVGAGRVSATAAADAGNALADQLLRYMDIMRVPDGLGALGFTNADVPALVEGTLPQKRVTNLSPHPVASEHLAQLFRASMKVY
jgi:hydroxyacid-oxoacid transhydrogenase